MRSISKKSILFVHIPQELGSVIWKGDSFHNSNENRMTPENNLIKDMWDLYAENDRNLLKIYFRKHWRDTSFGIRRLKTVKTLILAKYRVKSSGIWQANSKRDVEE